MSEDQLYTVLDRHGHVEAQGVSLTEAAQVVMGDDGHTYSIRKSADAKGFELWTSPFSRNSTAWRGETRSVISSLEGNEDLATAEIHRRVVENADWWNGCRVLTDAAYQAELKEIAEQEP